MERRARTSTESADDAKERARTLACVKGGVQASKGDDAKSTLGSIQEQSGVPLEKLVDTPEELVVAFRHLLGLGSVPIFSSIRRVLLLSSVGHRPRNGRVEALLLAFDKEKRSVKRGLLTGLLGSESPRKNP